MNTGNYSQSLFEEIDRFLPDATKDQVERFAVQVERLNQLKDFFKTYPEDLEGSKERKEQLERAQKALNYQRPYRIAVIGISGAGKSTMLNALLGRELVLTKTAGQAATGAALEIFFDISNDGVEKAQVSYRDDTNIRDLINSEFIQRYNLSSSGIPGDLDAGFASEIKRLEPSQHISAQDQDWHEEFKLLRKSIADLVVQYANNSNKTLPTDFSLDNPTDRKNLMEIIDENSVLNSENSPTRIIGLVKTVTYHIKPGNKVNLPMLQLPKNVCLVDLPGLDGSPLHDIIIREGIKEADAVILILRPRPLLGANGAYLLNRIRKYISWEGDVDSAEAIFVVLNAIDSINADRMPDNLQGDMYKLMENIVPGYTTHPPLAKRGGDQPYFLTSASAALFAQKALKGEEIKEPKTYEGTKVNLDVKNGSDQEVLEASQVPHLVAELTKFARDRRIEGQIKVATDVLGSIIELLRSNYERELNQIRSKRGFLPIQTRRSEILKNQQDQLERLVIDFRLNQIGRIDNLRQKLNNETGRICDDIDRDLKSKMPTIWEKAFTRGTYRPSAEDYGRPMYETVLGEAELNLWEQLTFRVPSLAEYLVRVYSDDLKTYQMARKIAEGCYGYVKADELQAKIEEWIDTNMHRTMVNIGGRIALTSITDPQQYGFLNPQVSQEKNPFIQSIVGSIPRQPIVNSSEFDQLISVVRQHYQPIVSGYCITQLLNLYRYEMILIEDKLLGYISNVFEKMQHTDDDVLKTRISKSLSDPDLERVELLELKLDALSRITPEN